MHVVQMVPWQTAPLAQVVPASTGPTVTQEAMPDAHEMAPASQGLAAAHGAPAVQP
jgi:hypothetical protein